MVDDVVSFYKQKTRRLKAWVVKVSLPITKVRYRVTEVCCIQRPEVSLLVYRSLDCKAIRLEE